MAEELTMPRLSDTMEEGTIGRWLKREGESFQQGEVIAEIETDKATMDFQAYEDGTLLRILVGDGESAPLGAQSAVVGAEGEEVPERVGAPASAPAAAGGNGASPPAAEPMQAPTARRPAVATGAA